ncbi:MAG: hypothetical protein A4E58_02450 [Syntrophorhabdus sp. PtaB.Bin006]|nr:MAG: hypothetical protein A4E58_02450 [Syntrophorhabdus sp. PtaB.Bin006]
MSTSLLYHGFGLVGYTYVKTVYEEGKVIFTVTHKRDKLHCPACGSRDLILRGCSPRRFRLVHRVEGDLARPERAAGSLQAV